MPHENYYLGKEIIRERQRNATQDQQVADAKQRQPPISRDEALEVCKQIRQELRMPLARLRCRRCMQRGQDGLPARLLVSSLAGTCQCAAITRHYLKTQS